MRKAKTLTTFNGGFFLEKKQMKNPLLLAFVFYYCILANANVQQYNLAWHSQSANSSQSMPCGGGDIGLNVWTENNEVLFYIARSGTFDEHNAMLKLGRVRIQISPNPFENGTFKQELDLQTGSVKISGGNAQNSVQMHFWVDVFRPVVHVGMQCSKPTKIAATYETWRYKDRLLIGKANNTNSYKWAPQGEVKLLKDSVLAKNNEVLFFHRNRADVPQIFDVAVRQQGLDSIKEQLFNPIANLTFGGLLQGKNLLYKNQTKGIYAGTDFVGHKLESQLAQRVHNITITLHVAQTATLDAWKVGLDSLIFEAKKQEKTAQKTAQTWWKNFWERSFIVLSPENAQDSLWKIGRNYQLFRYQLACNAFGKYPTKFNGGLFTYDPCFIDSLQNFTPDHRAWGGGTFTAQNQRLVYFPMFRSGDFEMLPSQLNFYLRLQKNAELRTQFYWGHAGASFTEQLENFALPNPSEYGWKRPPFFDKGMEYNAWLEYQWDTALEFCLMMLDLQRYANADISKYIPFVESCLTFFDEHYRYLAKLRGRKVLDQNNHLILYPGSACESYKMAYNAASTIAALQVVLARMIALPTSILQDEKKEQWKAMLATIPPITFREFDGKKTIAPAQLWERINNTEVPQLYPVFPWGIYGVGKPDLEIARNTYFYDTDALKFRSHIGWKQDNIFAARLGLADEAAKLCVQKLGDSQRRFPAFWGPGFDWTPDHNWGGAGMIGLQEMLLQTDNEKIYLVPALPKNWNVHFKLHAPYNTIIEAKTQNGKLQILNVIPAHRSKDIVVSEEWK